MSFRKQVMHSEEPSSCWFGGVHAGLCRGAKQRGTFVQSGVTHTPAVTLLCLWGRRQADYSSVLLLHSYTTALLNSPIRRSGFISDYITALIVALTVPWIILLYKKGARRCIVFNLQALQSDRTKSTTQRQHLFCHWQANFVTAMNDGLYIFFPNEILCWLTLSYIQYTSAG